MTTNARKREQVRAIANRVTHLSNVVQTADLNELREIVSEGLEALGEALDNLADVSEKPDG
jgi:hypothetical protein